MTGRNFAQFKLDGWVMRVRKADSASPGPAILALHGYSGDEHSMDVFTTRIPGSCHVLALRAPFLGSSGFSWVYRKSAPLPIYTDFSYSMTEIARRLNGWYEKLEIAPVDLNIIGFSQGAALGLCLLNEYPDLFQKTAILAGFLPELPNGKPLSENLAGKQIFVAHGTLDETIPVQVARTFVPQLKGAGARVQYCEEAVGHKLSAGCFAGLKEFFQA